MRPTFGCEPLSELVSEALPDRPGSPARPSRRTCLAGGAGR